MTSYHERLTEEEIEKRYEEALAVRDTGDIDLALEAFDCLAEAASWSPWYSTLLYETGYCFVKAGEPSDAINWFNRAIAMGFRDSIVHYNRACMAARCLERHRKPEYYSEVLFESLAIAVADDEQHRLDAIADPDFVSVLHLRRVRELLKLPLDSEPAEPEQRTE